MPRSAASARIARLRLSVATGDLVFLGNVPRTLPEGSVYLVQID